MDYDHDVLELNLESSFPGLDVEQDSVLQDFESASYPNQLTLDQELTDDFLSADFMDPPPKVDSESPELSPLDLSPLTEQDWEEAKISQPLEPSGQDTGPSHFNFEELKIGDDEQDLAALTEDDLDEFGFNLAETSGEESIKEEEYVSQESVEESTKEEECAIQENTNGIVKEEEPAKQEVDDLAARMEQTIRNLRANYPVPEKTEETVPEKTEETVVEEIASEEIVAEEINPEEVNTESAPPVLEPEKNLSLSEEIENSEVESPTLSEETEDIEEEDLSMSEEPEDSENEDNSQPIPADSLTLEQADSLKKSELITHLKSFQKNLENQFDPKPHEIKKT